MRFWGRHGTLASERRRGGPFRVDFWARFTQRLPCRDRLNETVDYRLFHAKIGNLMERRRFRTMEALADRIAQTTLKVPRVVEVGVRITKLRPPLGPGTTSAVEVELSRSPRKGS